MKPATYIQTPRVLTVLTALGILLLSAFTTENFSQTLRAISSRDGLPQSFVSGLVQDDSGFVWMATRNGIARYDGIEYKLFRHHPGDSNTISSNLVIWLQKDGNNKLWAEYETGDIDRLDPLTEKVQHFLKGNQQKGGVAFICRGWMVDSDNVFWGIARGAGLNSYDPNTKKINLYSSRNAHFPSDTLLGLVNTSSNEIWVLSNAALSKYNKATKQFEHYTIPCKQDYGDFAGWDAVAIDLHIRKNGELMWGDRHSLYFYNPKSGVFRTVLLSSVSYLGLRWIRTGFDDAEYLESFGRIYRYNDLDGVTPVGDNFSNFLADVKSFLADRSGMLWMGTNAKGILQLDLKRSFFQSFTYTKDFVADMLLREFGVSVQKNFGWTLADNTFSASGYHLRSVYGANQQLYIALKETVCVYDSSNKKFAILPPANIAGNSRETGIGIKGIAVGPDGAPLIIGFNGRILSYQASGKKWIDIVEPGLLRKTFGMSLLPQDIVSDGKKLWITTAADGLIIVDLLTKKIEQLKATGNIGALPTNQLIGIQQDFLVPEQLWIGSYEGLISLDKNTKRSKVYSLEEGLPDNTIYSVIADKKNNLWLSTNRGLCRFNPQTGEVRVFQTRHGLPSDEFNRFHHLRLPDGRLIFGGTTGWVSFNPDDIRDDEFEPMLGFTNLKINNTQVAAKQNTVLPAPLNALTTLVLPYEQNTVTFGFAGLEYNQPEDLQYRYRLNGYDKDWVLAGNTGQANYTKIPPGDYTLYVNASNTSGKWSSHVKILWVKIQSPWWSTKLAYLCYVIIIAGLIWTFMRFRVSQLLMKREMELKETESAQLKELDDMKTRFFSNITHEFRTPLTLITGPAEQLKTISKGNAQQDKLASTIVSNANQLLILINRLLDLTKLEAGAMKLHEQKGRPGEAVGAIVQSFSGDAHERGIELLYTDDTAQLDCFFYADALERIVYNLVSNALKFTGQQGKVLVKLNFTNEKLELTVTDTGIGIPKESLPYIFDRFYQAEQIPGKKIERPANGTGIGLSMVKELVAQLDGELLVDSQVTLPSGTVFTVLLPYKKTNKFETQDYVKPTVNVASEGLNDVVDTATQVLLVEDNREMADFITGILAEHYQVSNAANGAAGLEQALATMPDLVISDVMMPVMDGFEFCSKLKNDIRTSHIPVVLLTAKVGQSNVEAGLNKGADDYLTKPFHPAELLLRVRNLLTTQQKLRQRMMQELDTLEVAPTTEPVIIDIFLINLYKLLDEHLDESLFGVDQLAAELAISRSSLHRKLKSLTDLSTTEVVRNYRLKKATVFLKEGFSSSEAGYKAGFGSPAYFTKCFREVYGITPGDFVKQVK